MKRRDLTTLCERAFSAYHRPRFISPDPLEIVREYDNPADREVVALVAATLALGRVDGILKSVRDVLDRLRRIDVSPHRALMRATQQQLCELSDGFVYRFFDGAQLAGLLTAVSRCCREFGSLESLFALSAGNEQKEDPAARTVRGLDGMVRYLRGAADGALSRSILLAIPEKGSACKRLLLFLRWLVRSDEIDPGGWSVLAPAELLVPVDTHMLSIARTLRMCESRQASLRASRLITDGFRRISPSDPVRYDFSLTRLGIHPELDKDAFIHGGDFTVAANFATL